MVDVSRALMGLGAAIGGQAPQFRQQMMQEDEAARQLALQDEQAAEKRRQTLFQDAAAASSFLDQGDIGSVVNLMEDRYNILSQIPNVDTRHTRRYLDLARAASTGDVRALDALKTEMNNAVTAGRAYNQISMDESIPASFRALQMQAAAAGLPEGSPEYQEFMLYGGAGGQMGAAKTITYNNGTVVKIPRIGAPEVYGPNGQLVTDARQKTIVLDEAIRRGIAYESDVSTARELGTGQGARVNIAIETGISASEQIPDIKDALDLLDSVETGGLARYGIRMRRLLGTTPANEGELVNLLDEAVLGRLKSVFGAQFTEKEGALLRDISAGSQMSSAVNRRLLERALEALQERAARGMYYAQDFGDEMAARDIERSMSRDWSSYYDQQQQQQQIPPSAVQMGVTPDVWAEMSADERAAFN